MCEDHSSAQLCLCCAARHAGQQAHSVAGRGAVVGRYHSKAPPARCCAQQGSKLQPQTGGLHPPPHPATLVMQRHVGSM